MSGWTYAASDRMHSDRAPDDPDYVAGIQDGEVARDRMAVDGMTDDQASMYREGWGRELVGPHHDVFRQNEFYTRGATAARSAHDQMLREVTRRFGTG